MLYVIYTKSLVTGFVTHGTVVYPKYQAEVFAKDINEGPDYKGCLHAYIEPAFETKQRSSDWIAFVKGHPELWEAGETEEAAIEKLIATRGHTIPKE